MTFGEVLKQQVKENVMKVTKSLQTTRCFSASKKTKIYSKEGKRIQEKIEKKYKIINLLEQHNANA